MLTVTAVICAFVALVGSITAIWVLVRRDRRMEDFRQRQREQIDAEMWAELERRQASKQSEDTVGG